MRARFDAVYEKLYGRTYPESPVELVNFRVRARLPDRPLQLPRPARRTVALERAIKGLRQAYSGLSKGFIAHTVYDRYGLAPGARFPGPAIVEEKESTVVVGEDASASVDEHGFLWIELERG